MNLLLLFSFIPIPWIKKLQPYTGFKRLYYRLSTLSHLCRPVLALCITSISSRILYELSESPNITVRSLENMHLRCPLNVLLNMCFVENVVWPALGGSFDEVRCCDYSGGKLPQLTLSFHHLPIQPAAPLTKNTKYISKLQVKTIDKLTKNYMMILGRFLAWSQGCFIVSQAPSVCYPNALSSLV